MSRERELLKKALDFMLDAGANLNPLFKEINDNLLAQPEQEPVAWIIHNKVTGVKTQVAYKPADCCWDIIEIIPLYTAPPKREPLSDEAIVDLWWNNYVGTAASVCNFARGIEKAHGIGENDE